MSIGTASLFQTRNAPLCVRVESSDVGENVGKTEEDVGESIQSQILKLLELDPSISATKIAKQLKMSTRHIERVLAALRDEGVIRRVGPARGGHWKIVRH